MTSTARNLGHQHEAVFENWLPLAHARPTALSQARVQVHWAAQLVSAAAEAHGEGGGNLHWHHEREMLASPPLGADGFRCGLHPASMDLILFRDDERGGAQLLEALTLDGVRYHRAFDWLEEALSAVSDGALSRSLERHRHSLPPHPLATGAPFAITDAEENRELARWFADADLALGSVASLHGVAGPSFEPAHASLRLHIPVDERGRVVAGMSPGDAGVPEPHFFALPEPRPAVRELLVLSEGGQWRTAGWFGAILCASRLARPEAGRQPRQVLVFLETAIESCETLLGALTSPSER